MSYTIYFQPRNKISGVREGSATYATAHQCLSQWEMLERSDEKARVEDEKGRQVSRPMLEVLAKEERDASNKGAG